MAFQFISKSFVKAVYSDAQSLNLIPSDLGAEMIRVAYETEAVRRLPTAVGTVAAAEIYQPARISIQVLKTSPAGKIYVDRVRSNGVILGTLTIYDDSNVAHTYEQLSMNVTGFTADTSEPHYSIEVMGNVAVNKDLIAQIGQG